MILVKYKKERVLSHATLSPQAAASGQTLALAGILQSVHLVNQIATTGSANPESFNATINSLFQFDTDTPLDVFGGIAGVSLGLDILKDILSGSAKQDYRAHIRYSLAILHLQKKSGRDAEMMTLIHRRLEHASLKAEHFTDNQQEIAASCAAIYQDTISKFKYRVQVAGNAHHLQNNVNADNIRALLLAGIRSAVLWRQMGGRRWQLFFSRGRLLKTAKELQGKDSS
ncbi:MAG: high frequency lysogenization protein [Gammaproteobacteria bacterium]